MPAMRTMASRESLAPGPHAVLLLGSTGGPRLSATVSLFQVLGYNLLWSAPCSSFGSWS